MSDEEDHVSDLVPDTGDYEISFVLDERVQVPLMIILYIYFLLIQSYLQRDTVQYLVRWYGYDATEDSWVDASDFRYAHFPSSRNLFLYSISALRICYLSTRNANSFAKALHLIFRILFVATVLLSNLYLLCWM